MWLITVKQRIITSEKQVAKTMSITVCFNDSTVCLQPGYQLARIVIPTHNLGPSPMALLGTRMLPEHWRSKTVHCMSLPVLDESKQHTVQRPEVRRLIPKNISEQFLQVDGLGPPEIRILQIFDNEILERLSTVLFGRMRLTG